MSSVSVAIKHIKQSRLVQAETLADESWADALFPARHQQLSLSESGQEESYEAYVTSRTA